MKLEPFMGPEARGADPLRMPSGDYTLVVLGGPDDAPPGFLLGPARLSLGAGESDDVFLSGVGVVPNHVRLVFLEGQVTILSATEEVRVDGQTVTAFPAELRPLQTLSLSPDTHLAYGLVGSDWPQPPAWLVDPPPESSGFVSDLETSKGESAISTDRRAVKPRTVRQRVVHSARLGAVVMGVAALLMVAVALGDLIWGNREVVNPGEVAIDRSAEVLQKMIDGAPGSYGRLRLVRREDGAITLRGFLDSEDVYRALAEQVRQQVVSSGGNVRLDALTLGRLEALIRDQIGRYPLGSRVEADSDGLRVMVFGVQTEALDAARLTSELGRLRERVRPVPMDLTIDLVPVGQISQEIAETLTRSPITRELQFTMADSRGIVSGVVAPAAEEEARRILDSLKTQLAERVPLTIDLKVDPKLNFSLVGVALGGEGASASLLQRGRAETFRVGDTVFGTGELREIRRDGVVLAFGRRELFIPLAMR